MAKREKDTSVKQQQVKKSGAGQASAPAPAAATESKRAKSDGVGIEVLAPIKHDGIDYTPGPRGPFSADLAEALIATGSAVLATDPAE